MVYPDCVGLSIDEARRKIYEFDKEVRIVTIETHSFKDNDLKALTEAIVVRQKNEIKSVELIVAFF